MSKQGKQQSVAQNENLKTTGILQRVKSGEEGDRSKEVGSSFAESRFQADLAKVPVRQSPNKTGLPDRLKAGVERLSGYSLDDVRVHYNSPKPAELQALAYTQGTEIYVGPGQEKHLGLEAWHVVQPKQGRVRETQKIKGLRVSDQEKLEQEASVMGKNAGDSQSVHSPNISTSPATTDQICQMFALGEWSDYDGLIAGQSEVDPELVKQYIWELRNGTPPEELNLNQEIECTSEYDLYYDLKEEEPMLYEYREVEDDRRFFSADGGLKKDIRWTKGRILTNGHHRVTAMVECNYDPNEYVVEQGLDTTFGYFWEDVVGIHEEEV